MNFGQERISRLLFVVAMDAEEDAVARALPGGDIVEVSQAYGLSARRLKKDARELFVLKSGIGLANSAAAVALAAEKWGIQGVISAGVAGGLVPSLAIGDMFLADSIRQHDSVFSGEAGNENMAPGQPFVSVEPGARAKPDFPTAAGFGIWLASRKPSVARGLLLSGSEFVGTGARKAELARLHPGALAVEMEAAGMAVIAARLGIPFAAVKTIADRLNPDHSVSHDYRAFLGGAAENAATVAAWIWEDWNHAR